MTFEEANDIADRAEEYFTRGRCRGEIPTTEEVQKASEAFGIEEAIYLCQDCARFAECRMRCNRVSKVSKCNFYVRDEVES